MGVSMGLLVETLSATSVVDKICDGFRVGISVGLGDIVDLCCDGLCDGFVGERDG